MDKRILALLATISITVGCQPGSSPQGEITNASLSNNCHQSKVTSVDATDAKIDSEAGAQPGQVVAYSLNAPELDCSSNQSVSWKAANSASAKMLSQEGAEASSVYKKAGVYVMTAQIQTEGSSEVIEVSQKTVIANGLVLTGPDVGSVNTPVTFSLVNILGSGAESAVWNFGDNTPTAQGLEPVSHSYVAAGTYTVTATVTLGDGSKLPLTTVIQILDGGTNPCLGQLAVTGPSTGVVGTPVSLSVFIPACMTLQIGSVAWDFGDNTSPAFSQSVQHTYNAVGSYMVVVTLYRVGEMAPFVTLTHGIQITQVTEPEEPEEPEVPHLCPIAGENRTVNGEIYSKEEACGILGKRVDSYRDSITEQCQAVDGVRKWVEVSRTSTMTNQGECQGQACEVKAPDLAQANPTMLGLKLVNGKYYLAHGQTVLLYSSQTPAGTCSSVSSMMTCNNGVPSFDDSAQYLTCHEGCPGFGAHGTTQTGVITGTENVPMTCAFGETVNSIYNTIADKQCIDGSVVTSNTRRGDVKTPGVCPIYQWTATQNYTTCDAACGGTQTQIHVCTDAEGNTVPNERCSGAAPVVTRVCDGNPDAVKRSESSTSIEEGGATKMCPKNQIGVVISQREVTTTKNYACIDHKVQLAGETVTNGPWTTVEYCKQFVAYRCSGDSLSNTDATGRYKWMVKCRPNVKAIDEFLTEFDQFVVDSKNGELLSYNGKQIYPTFAQYMSGTDKQWKAPVKESASCSVPNNIYVAAVCSASCALPQEQILSSTHHKDLKQLGYRAFIENWTEQVGYVATMRGQTSINSSKMAVTKVDQWVTELYDAENEIVTFKTESGGSLAVTLNHPVLAANGSMKMAADFKVGDSLVRQGGALDRIVSADHHIHFGKVYNVYVQSADPLSNVVATNGFLNGTAFYQNEGADMLNKKVLQNRLIKGVFDK